MKSLTIKIKFGNDAMTIAAEAVEAIRKAQIANHCFMEVFEGVIKDINGNIVGSWKAIK